VARPWKKQWPYVGKRGAKSYRLGFRDHDGVERTRAFPSAKSAKEWMDAYVSAERRGPDSLRRFLLDLDAREANGSHSGRTIGEVIQLYFAFNAPDTEDGLAGSTFRTYRHVASRHLLGLQGMTAGKPTPVARYAAKFATQPAVAFNEPTAPRALREAMKDAKVGPSARAHTWRVLSAVLSWAASSQVVPEIATNGCLLANERVSNRRKSMRGSGGAGSVRRSGAAVSGWALSPTSVELIRAQMLYGSNGGSPTLLAERDAVVVSLQFGLALRNQEVFGLRWSSFVEQHRARIKEVLGWHALDSRGKTEKATGRTARVPLLLEEDLKMWRALLRRHGFSTRGADFVIPGNIAGAGHGVIEKITCACHMSNNQACQWRSRCFKPAVKALADRRADLADLVTATPYSLRRGGVSARLRGENAQSVAEQCGTSLEMLSRHYSYEIDDFAQSRPQSLDAQWRTARTLTLKERTAAPAVDRAG
jgi:integrase